MYLLLVIAALLFSIQFMFNQKYQQSGGGVDSSLLFQVNVGILIIIMMLMMNQFRIRITVFSLVLAFVQGLVLISYLFFSMKAFKSANLTHILSLQCWEECCCLLYMEQFFVKREFR